MKPIYIIALLVFNSFWTFAQEEDTIQISKQEEMLLNQPAPDFVLPNLEWEEISLSEIDSKVILLDFWASWCKYCRTINQENVGLYELYHNEGFEIVSISIDKDYYKWKQAIQMDNLTWINVNDKIGMDSDVGKSYYLDHTPTTFLLDKNKNIVAIDLEDDALEDKIKELLK